MSPLNRIILLITGHSAGYMIIAGIEGYNSTTMFYFTIGFGVLVLSCLLLILFGFEVLEKSLVVVVAALIPLSFAIGIVTQFFSGLHLPVLLMAALGLLVILVSRIKLQGKVSTILLAVVHGSAGLVLVLLPLFLAIKGLAPIRFVFVGIGGALIGLGGLLLAFLKTGRPILSKKTILTIFPILLLLMTLMFVFGMSGDPVSI